MISFYYVYVSLFIMYYVYIELCVSIYMCMWVPEEMRPTALELALQAVCEASLDARNPRS